MSDERAKRKLSAILSADVKGYSRLMGEDELSTIETLKRHRKLISSLIKQYRGRVVDSPGDNLLAEFGSAVYAVECAVKIQEKLKKETGELLENRRMEFRIGVNLGDVVEDDKKIYGDGVNIAARIEGLADGGGICISRSAYDQVKGKLNFKYEYLGEHQVKNIDEPIRVYKVLIETTSEEVMKEDKIRESIFEDKITSSLSDKPSIAVLPFDNMSKDPEQEYFSDGITEEIITGLSKIPKMYVIARNSTFVYKKKKVKAQQVGRELGVRYVLEGSVRKAGNRIRVTAQLIDAATGYHLWAERYDRELINIFALQDEITMKVLIALLGELTNGEQVLKRNEPTKNLEAWGYAIKAFGVIESGTKEGFLKAKDLFENAVALDPEYADAWTGLAYTYWFDARFGYSGSPLDSIKQTSIIAQKVLSLDETNPYAHALTGCIHLLRREYEKAIGEVERAVTLGPSYALVHALSAHVLRFSGKFERAIVMINKAIRLQPYLNSWYLSELGMCYYCIGRYEKALYIAEKFRRLAQIRGDEIVWNAYLILAMNYIRLGHEKEGRIAARELIRLNPDYSLEMDRRYSIYKDKHVLEAQHDDLRKAGLPEKAPGSG